MDKEIKDRLQKWASSHKTDSSVSQGFYQALCFKAIDTIEELEKEVKSLKEAY